MMRNDKKTLFSVVVYVRVQALAGNVKVISVMRHRGKFKRKKQQHMLQQSLLLISFSFCILNSMKKETQTGLKTLNKYWRATSTLLKYSVIQCGLCRRYLALRETALGEVVCRQDPLSPTWSGSFQQGGRLERREQFLSFFLCSTPVCTWKQT